VRKTWSCGSRERYGFSMCLAPHFADRRQSASPMCFGASLPRNEDSVNPGNTTSGPFLQALRSSYTAFVALLLSSNWSKTHLHHGRIPCGCLFSPVTETSQSAGLGHLLSPGQALWMAGSGELTSALRRTPRAVGKPRASTFRRGARGVGATRPQKPLTGCPFGRIMAYAKVCLLVSSKQTRGWRGS